MLAVLLINITLLKWFLWCCNLWLHTLNFIGLVQPLPSPPRLAPLPPSLLLAMPLVVESFVCRFFIGGINVTLITLIVPFLRDANLAALCCSRYRFSDSYFGAPSTQLRRYSSELPHTYRYCRRPKSQLPCVIVICLRRVAGVLVCIKRKKSCKKYLTTVLNHALVRQAQ